MTNIIERHFPAYKGELKKLYGFKKDFWLAAGADYGKIKARGY